MDDFIDKTLEEWKIGGLGIHFVRKMMKKVEYERTENNNIVILTKDF
jgi:anti-sigma regulatory factor (Ser/Thr protein kinase)